MPKETIHGQTLFGADEPPWRVDVAWGRDTHVQLTTLTGEGLGIKTVDPDSADGLWVSLDREAINRLIRVLRKARDQAFGIDE